jgi:hypothetical protein
MAETHADCTTKQQCFHSSHRLPPGVSETARISPIVLHSRELPEAVKEQQAYEDIPE